MKKMKTVIAMGLAAIMLSSCATVFGGKVTAHQKTKPAAGEQQREIRIGALIADVLLFWPGAIVDFATGAIYKHKR
jgi:PBP1b-binding outer membrane lipoprotein LpoB